MTKSNLIPIARFRSSLPARFNPLVMLQRDVSRVFEDFWNDLAKAPIEFTPSMDVSETDRQIEMAVEIPGLEEKDVQIEVADNTLKIRGEKKAEKEEKGKDFRTVERSYGSFFRSLELPRGTDPDKIKAVVSKGVLKVTIEKPAVSEVKKIDVKAA